MNRLLRRWLLPVVVAAALCGGCATAAAGPPGAVEGPGRPPGGASDLPARSAPSASTRPANSEPPVSRAREGRTAASERVRFRPESLVLSRGGQADVEVASTLDGELKVPENVRHLGWWDGGAYVNDPFGTVVIAGHVDSKTQGLGFFARLLRAEKGDEVTLRGDGHQLRYRVTATKTLTKQVLGSDSDAFDQSGDHRLVLITCTGNYDADRGGYDSNLVLYAEPVGLAS